MNKSKKIQNLTSIALMAAIVAVTAQITIPLPGGVPMTLQTFAVIAASIIVGPADSFSAMLIYLLLGAVGLPVFSGFKGGLACLAGPTAGFIISFPVMALLIGLGAKKNRQTYIAMLILGMLFNYGAGLLMFCILTGSSASAGIAACILPFIPADIVKAAVGSVLGFKVRKILSLQHQ